MLSPLSYLWGETWMVCIICSSIRSQSSSFLLSSLERSKSPKLLCLFSTTPIGLRIVRSGMTFPHTLEITKFYHELGFEWCFLFCVYPFQDTLVPGSSIFQELCYGACCCISKASLHLAKWADNTKLLVFSLGVDVRGATISMPRLASMQSQPVLVGHRIAMLGGLTFFTCVGQASDVCGYTWPEPFYLNSLVALSMPVCPCL